MKIFGAAQVREIDDYTIKNEPVASIDLMERAASQLHSWYVQNYHTDRSVVIFAGPGNNGGDALALARMLAESAYSVYCYVLGFGKRSVDSALNLTRLEEQNRVKLLHIDNEKNLPGIGAGDVVIDGIFGSGLSRKAEGLPAAAIQHINSSGTEVVAIDIPSGLFGEDNSNNDPASVIRADHTLSFQFPFLSFFFDSNNNYVGNWHILDIKLHKEAIASGQTEYSTIEAAQISALFPARDTFSHKGTFGHALLIAGSYGMMGAALLSGEACLRAGVGLLTLHVPRNAYQIIQTALPEAIVSLDRSDILFSEAPDLEAFSSIGIGPGLGCKTNSGRGLKKLLEEAKVPLVIDADALNILAASPELCGLLPPGTILTPHPGEFDRLIGKSLTAWERHLEQRKFVEKYGVIVVLKGAYTGIAVPGGYYYINTKGNPGMATGGSGDVLTGMIAGLLAGGMSSADAARAAVYLHGLAGDLAALELGQEAMLAGDIIRYLGKAFLSLS